MLNINIDLPKEKIRIIDALLNKIENNYKNDISVVVCYGSYITGTSYQKSDIDFFFIPKTEKGYEMSYQFIIDSIGYDFWPISWQRANKIANFDDSLTSIIANGVLVYYCDSDDLERFNLLKQRVIDITTNPVNKDILLNKSENMLVAAKALFFDMINKSDDYDLVISNCSKILSLLLNVVAYINSTYIKKAVYNVENEVSTYSVLPERFLELFNLVARNHNSKVMIDTINQLILNVSELQQKMKYKREIKISNDTFKGFYEELKSAYNKLIHACNTKDYLKAYFTAHSINIEIKSILGEKYKDFGFPNLLVPLEDKNYNQIIKLTYQHESVLINLLKTYKVDVSEYGNVDEFITSLKYKVKYFEH